MPGTPTSTRSAPSRRFENYVLTRVVDQSVGLTSFKDSNFTQLNGPNDYTGFNIGQGFCDDGYSFVTPIGFDFQLDGITYKQFVANSNGWLALVDPALGTFTPTNVLSASYSSINPITAGTIYANSSSLPTSSNGSWQNAAIRPSFASNAVIIAPWFDDLRNIPNTTAQLLLSPFSFGATKVNNINKGIEPRPVQLDQIAYGVSYLIDGQSTKGRRLIIRWNCLSNYVAPSTSLKFEAILYENGTIEFRYAPRTLLKLQGSSVEGATIGIFMPNGTNRFRDFAIGLGYRDDARQEYIYGGYIFTASYVDTQTSAQEDFPATASYTINLQPAQYWPGLITGGSIFTFSPPVRRRKTLTALKARSLGTALTLPTVARTGDSRLGVGLSYFDDRYASPFTSAGSYVPLVDAALDNQSVQVPPISLITPQIYTCGGVTTTTVTIPGDPNTTFNVTLRLRGVVEQKTITGGVLVAGTVGATTLGMMLGGTPAGDSRNVISLAVSNPSQTYYLNNGTSGVFIVYAIDYTVTIPMVGGSTITLKIDSVDNQELINAASTGGPLTIPGISTPTPQPYAGQFVTMNVVAISTSGFTASTQGQVNYPTTLPRFLGGTAPGTLEKQNLFTGDFLVTGSVVKSAADPYLIERSALSTAAFNEEKSFEQSMSSSFYLTGSSLNDVGPGFDGSLKSKTQIKLQFPVDTAVQLPGVTSSIYYYNRGNKSWNVPQNTSYTLAAGATTHPAGQPGGDWMDPTWNSAGTNTGTWFAEDARGFGPIGNVRASGSHQQSAAYDQTDGNFGPLVVYNATNTINALNQRYPKSVANNDEYQPTNDETFTLPITAPYLIEKAVIEIPFSMGAGWFLDQTQTRFPVPYYAIPPNNEAADFGGPGMTVALHRVVQLSEKSPTPARRDLILTGTITHQADNIRSVVLANTPDITGAGDPGFFQLRNVGFLSYADRASAVVTPTNNQFTGSVMIECEATVAHGMMLNFKQAITGAIGSVQSLLTTPNLTLQNTLGLTAIQNPSPFGRGGTGFDQSGRSILGKEFGTLQNLSDPSGATVPNPFYVASGSLPSNITAAQVTAAQNSGTLAVTTIPLVGHFKSPYLVMPGDKLVLSLSKVRPAIFSRVASWFSGSYPGTGHDVQLTVGTISITLYGSQVKEGVEFHDTLNQPLASDAVHEIIGAEPVIDQFEASYRDEYTGSYSDNVMLGALLTPTSSFVGNSPFAQGVRDRKLSVLNARNAPALTTASADILINPYKAYRLQPWHERVGSGVRHAQFFSNTERFFDSMVPSFAQCITADGCGIFIESVAEANANGFRDLPGIPDAVLLTIGQLWFDLTVFGTALFSPVTDTTWTHAYPFEPRYASVTRLLNTNYGFLANYLLDQNGALLHPTPYTPVIGIMPMMPMPKLSSSLYYHLADSFVGAKNGSGLYTTSSAVPDDVARVLYGFGDNNTIHFISNNTGFIVPYSAGNVTQQGTNHYASFRDVDDNNIIAGNYLSPTIFSPIIRGWKYGLLSALPTFSKAYWRHSRFGQFRDMLEQRLDSKYFESPENGPVDPDFQQGMKDAVVNVKFLNPNNGRSTPPDTTWSSNLSFECTSSMPYFDDISTNRPKINPALLNRSIINLSTDGNGNVVL